MSKMKGMADISDTAREADEVLEDLFRSAPPWRKLELMDEWSRSLRILVSSELSRLHPDKSADEIRVLLAERLYGTELAAAVAAKSR